MGSLEKVVLQYDHAFWDQGAKVILAADARDGAFAAFVNLLPLTGQAALMALNGGGLCTQSCRPIHGGFGPKGKCSLSRAVPLISMRHENGQLGFGQKVTGGPAPNRLAQA